MSKRWLCYFPFTVMTIYIMATILACSGDDPQPGSTPPETPDVPTDTLSSDTFPDVNQGTSPDGINTTINGWGSDGNENGGTAQ